MTLRDSRAGTDPTVGRRQLNDSFTSESTLVGVSPTKEGKEDLKTQFVQALDTRITEWFNTPDISATFEGLVRLVIEQRIDQGDNYYACELAGTAVEAAMAGPTRSATIPHRLAVDLLPEAPRVLFLCRGFAYSTTLQLAKPLESSTLLSWASTARCFLFLHRSGKAPSQSPMGPTCASSALVQVAGAQGTTPRYSRYRHLSLNE